MKRSALGLLGTLFGSVASAVVVAVVLGGSSVALRVTTIACTGKLMIGGFTVMVIGVPGAAVVAGTVRSTIGGVAVMTLAAPSAEEAGGVVVPLTTTVRGFSVGVAFAFAFLLDGFVGRVFFLVPDGFVGAFVFFVFDGFVDTFVVLVVLDGFVGTLVVLVLDRCVGTGDALAAAAVLDGVVDTA